MIDTIMYAVNSIYNLLGYSVINFGHGFHITLLEVIMGCAIVALLFWVLGKIYN